MRFDGLMPSLLGLLLLLMVAIPLRQRLGWMRNLFLPTSLVAGALAVLLGPEVFGRLAALNADFGARVVPLTDQPISQGLIPLYMRDAWRGLPGILISVVFAALFLGERLPSLGRIWQLAGPQVAFGQTLAWGQYVVGLSLALLVLGPVFGLPPLAGALIEIAFEGGHGTAAGLGPTFEALGFPEGADLAVGLATMGLVSGVVLGTVLVNWRFRRGALTYGPHTALDEPDRSSLDPVQTGADAEPRERAGLHDVSLDGLTLHLALVGLAIFLGWGLLQGLIAWENAAWNRAGDLELIANVPLFPLAMLGGVMIQVVADSTGLGRFIDRRMMQNISGWALDFTVAAAIASISLQVLGQNMWPLLILAGAGIAWNVGAFLLLAPLIIPRDWFERGIGDFGQSMGVTVTGLLLMRLADPRNRSGALESFGYKQLLFEPFVGGGLVTAAAMPLILRFGAEPLLAVTAGITLFWIAFGFLLFGRPSRRRARSS